MRIQLLTHCHPSPPPPPLLHLLPFSMDNHPENTPHGSQPPRKELQGPRPTPLKVRKGSYKIKKPPVVQPQQPPRLPVIIYTVSPKVIHTNPGDFMMLVQRLTGSNSTSSSASASCSSSRADASSTCAISPAARFASVEKTKIPLEGMMASTDDVGFVEGVEVGGLSERPGNSPGILSPGPRSLPPVSPNFFSPLFMDPNTFGLHHGLSNPVQAQHRRSSSSFMPSPSSANFFSPSTTMFSPSSLDFLRNFLD
ncbi:hypothetical protein Ancab_036309 [Ancistrocladus abbreviatus]